MKTLELLWRHPSDGTLHVTLYRSGAVFRGGRNHPQLVAVSAIVACGPSSIIL